MTTIAMRKLMCAVIKQAAIDYRKNTIYKKDAENFLQDFSELSRYILQELKKEEQEKEARRKARKNRKAIDNPK